MLKWSEFLDVLLNQNDSDNLNTLAVSLFLTI